MAPKIFVDTSVWLAYLLKSEPDHARVKSSLAKYLEEGTLIFTSNDVIDETVTRLVYKTNPVIVKNFLGLLAKSLTARALTQIWVDEAIQSEACKIVQKYADQKLSLTDATSMVICKRFSITTVLTLDSDFAKLGFNSAP